MGRSTFPAAWKLLDGKVALGSSHLLRRPCSSQVKLSVTQFLTGKTEIKYILTLDFPSLHLTITNLFPLMAMFFYMVSVEDQKNSE